MEMITKHTHPPTSPAGTVPTWRRWLIRAALGTALVLCLTSWVTRKCLYPFDPFEMYSYSFTGSIRDLRLLGVLNTGQSISLHQIGSVTEDEFGSLVKANYQNDRARGFEMTSRALAAFLVTCRDHLPCYLSARTGESVRAEHLIGLRVVRQFYSRMDLAHFGHPDREKLLGEAYYGEDNPTNE
jgi:hypothetical protein